MYPYAHFLLFTLPYFIIAGTSNADFVAIENVEKQMWGLQFHPEVTHSPLGKDILKNFVVNIANAKQDWVMTDYANE
jgi:GMP synthase (glutamine-hydrolysing)